MLGIPIRVQFLGLGPDVYRPRNDGRLFGESSFHRLWGFVKIRCQDSSRVVMCFCRLFLRKRWEMDKGFFQNIFFGDGWKGPRNPNTRAPNQQWTNFRHGGSEIRWWNSPLRIRWWTSETNRTKNGRQKLPAVSWEFFSFRIYFCFPSRWKVFQSRTFSFLRV